MDLHIGFRSVYMLAIVVLRHIITYHHGYTKKNNGMYHAIKSHECPGQR